MDALAWGVDGFGAKHYLCNHCEMVFGAVHPETVIHKCDTSKPKYHNRDKQHDPTTTAQNKRPAPSRTKGKA